MGQRPMVTEAEVTIALEAVNDPHIPVSLARMKMLRGVRVSPDGHVDVELGIPCMSCPGVSMLKTKINDVVRPLAGVTSVSVHEGWHHHWTADMVDDQTRDYMRKYGIQI